MQDPGDQKSSRPFCRDVLCSLNKKGDRAEQHVKNHPDFFTDAATII